jgi:hypothetical protein
MEVDHMRNPNLRLDDLVSRGQHGREESKLMNVKLPTHLLARLDSVAKKLGSTKTEVVVAILNEGLDTADQELKGWKAPPKPVVPTQRRCKLKGCEREKVAKGLCATHYQAQRRAS